MPEDGVLQVLETRTDEGPPPEVPGAAEAIRLLQEKYALSVLRELLSGPLNFTELQARTQARSAGTLQARLTALQAAGVVRRRHVLFELTRSGAGLGPLFLALSSFSARYAEVDPEALLRALQRRGAIRVMRELMGGSLGFNELQRAVGAASATTLARRLGDLEALGLIDKTVHSAMPPRTAYAHSDIGRAFSEVVGHIVFWGEGLPLELLPGMLAGGQQEVLTGTKKPPPDPDESESGLT